VCHVFCDSAQQPSVFTYAHFCINSRYNGYFHAAIEFLLILKRNIKSGNLFPKDETAKSPQR
jgi:hypothetical protein